jgi:hypothetical protein
MVWGQQCISKNISVERRLRGGGDLLFSFRGGTAVQNFNFAVLFQ